jgi:hypothetical protein
MAARSNVLVPDRRACFTERESRSRGRCLLGIQAGQREAEKAHALPQREQRRQEVDALLGRSGCEGGPVRLRPGDYCRSLAFS